MPAEGLCRAEVRGAPPVVLLTGHLCGISLPSQVRILRNGRRLQRAASTACEIAAVCRKDIFLLSYRR